MKKPKFDLKKLLEVYTCLVKEFIFGVSSTICTGSCSHQIKVNFVGKEAVDVGGPSREFWMLLVHAIKQKYCRGDVEEGRVVFERNTPALQVNKLSVCILYFLIAIKILIKRSYDINAATICDMPNIPFTQHSELRMLGILWPCLHYKEDQDSQYFCL